jgi:nucleoside 2-deoxyribosyltransferase
MKPPVKAIETCYKGYRFRSRLEARWAVFWDALGVPYDYEPQGFDLGELGWYLPDFWLPNEKLWVEIKPGPPPAVLRLYLAGKMTDWRDSLDLRGHWQTGPHETSKAHNITYHGSDLNGEQEVVASCREGIEDADCVFCWVDSLDCYGTLLEVGYARARGKRVVLAFHPSTLARLRAKAGREYLEPLGNGDDPPEHAMWFVEEFAEGKVVAASAQEALDTFLPAHPPEELKCAALSVVDSCILVYGDPWEGSYRGLEFQRGRSYGKRYGVFRLWPQAVRDSLGRELHLTSGGGWYGPPCSRMTDAYAVARSARFEHGEVPRL